MVGLGKDKVWATSTAAVFSLILLTSLTLPPFATAQNNQDETELRAAGCSEEVHLQTQAKVRNLDEGKARNLATSSQGFNDKTAGLQTDFESIFNTWSVDPDCNIAWNDVNVVYVVKDAAGNPLKKVVVTEDPELTKVVRVEEQHANIRAPNFQNNAFQNGYVLRKPSTPIYEAKATWPVSSVQPPSQGCQGVHCDIVVWVGLEGTSPGVVQGGSRGGVFCFGVCSYTYKIWYEFYPDTNLTDCSTPVSPGHSVTTTVTNHKKYGLSNWDYTITILNNSIGQACTVTRGFTTMGPTPYDADFIIERPYISGSLARLPQFTQYTTSSATLWYNGASQPAYGLYSAGTYTDITMKNPPSGGTQNISKSAISTSSSWTTTWLSSQNT
ncbi:MAG: G1 family glutamic endopeptidase [Nitrososphaera sp.]